MAGDEGTTALHKAEAGRQTEMVRLLLAAGADASIADANWNSAPGSWTQYYGLAEAAKLLEAAVAAGDAGG